MATSSFESKWKCTLCDHCFATERNLIQHGNRKRKCNELRVCLHCGYDNYNQMARHKRVCRMAYINNYVEPPTTRSNPNNTMNESFTIPDEEIVEENDSVWHEVVNDPIEMPTSPHDDSLNSSDGLGGDQTVWNVPHHRIKQLENLQQELTDYESACGFNKKKRSYTFSSNDFEVYKDYELVPDAMRSTFQCLICKRKFHNLQRITFHLKHHHSTQKTCEICNHNSKELRNYESHTCFTQENKNWTVISNELKISSSAKPLEITYVMPIRNIMKQVVALSVGNGERDDARRIASHDLRMNLKALIASLNKTVNGYIVKGCPDLHKQLLMGHIPDYENSFFSLWVTTKVSIQL